MIIFFTQMIQMITRIQEKPKKYAMRKETREINLLENESKLKIEIGTMVKSAAKVAAGVATGGVGAVMGLVDSLKDVAAEMSFGSEESEKKIRKHRSDNDCYFFLEIVYSSKEKHSGFATFKKTELQVDGKIYVTYMEALDEAAKQELQALTAENAASAIDYIKTAIQDEK